jgi:phosphatidylglycerol---prolipoprotein diacylglyceryl transferase
MIFELNPYLCAKHNNLELLYITWDMNPSVIPSWNMPRWYGLMWALGFYLGYMVLNRMYKAEQAPVNWMDKTFFYVLIAGILGARLGHCLFYQPDYYLAHPVEILKIWEGGLASHGGAFGIILAVYFLNRNVIHQSMLYILDRLVVPTALAGCLIRLGNLFNHEIVGAPSDAPWAFWFTLNDPGIPVPRHPAQLYEAICYLLIFVLLMYLYWRTNASQLKGFITGMFFITCFGSRFLIEFIKEDQVDFESGMLINMGQILSLPLILFGIYLVAKQIRSLKSGGPVAVKPAKA